MGRMTSGKKMVGWSAPKEYQQNKTINIHKKYVGKSKRLCRITKTKEHDFKLIKEETDRFPYLTNKDQIHNSQEFKCGCGKKMTRWITLDRDTGKEIRVTTF